MTNYRKIIGVGIRVLCGGSAWAASLAGAMETATLHHCGVFQKGGYGFGVKTTAGEFFEFFGGDSVEIKNQVELLQAAAETNPHSGCVRARPGKCIDSRCIVPMGIELYEPMKNVEYVKMKMCGVLTKKPLDKEAYVIDIEAGSSKYSVAHNSVGPGIQKEFDKLPMNLSTLGCVHGVLKTGIPNWIYPHRDDARDPVAELKGPAGGRRKGE